MIATGSCELYRSTMSTMRGPSDKPSSRSAAVSSTRSRSAATAREVNTDETVLR